MGSNRRDFLKSVSVGAFSCTVSWPSVASAQEGDPDKPLRFGIITDIHKDIMHDADDRLQAFIDEMTAENVDFIIQVGDFCVPKPENKGFLAIWNQFAGPRYHVIGNHDTDGGFTREQTVAFWGMDSRFYSFDRSGVHFVVLDGNDKPTDHAGGYPRYIAEDQIDWLKKDVEATGLPTVVFIHQSVERKSGIQNGAAIRAVFEDANRKAGFRKVVACFSGHHHRDYVRQINDVVYPQINSASYYWVGGDFLKVRYSEEIDAGYPYIKYTVPYKDPIYAIATMDTHRGFLSIEGKRSEFVGPPPWELGKTREAWEAQSLTPDVSDWKMPI